MMTGIIKVLSIFSLLCLSLVLAFSTLVVGAKWYYGKALHEVYKQLPCNEYLEGLESADTDTKRLYAKLYEDRGAGMYIDTFDNELALSKSTFSEVIAYCRKNPDTVMRDAMIKARDETLFRNVGEALRKTIIQKVLQEQLMVDPSATRIVPVTPTVPSNTSVGHGRLEPAAGDIR